MPKISSDTLISPDFTAKEWADLRKRLIASIDGDWGSDWEKCLKVLSDRVDNRFLTPIQLILQNDTKKEEGFTITTILCILLEFFSALYSGKIYTTKELSVKEYPLPFEYKSSRALIKDFLSQLAPFNNYFDPKIASKFYDNVRCGLLHEARTKGNWKIKEKMGDKLVEEIGSDYILYRTGFFNALNEWFNAYKEELKGNITLKINLLRKMDDILDNPREAYFAYGSNMDKEQMKDRGVIVHTKYKAVLPDFAFAFNKYSKIDHSGKANIESKKGANVYGIVYEIDKSALESLDRYELGYERQQIYVQLMPKNEKVRCLTYICKQGRLGLTPTQEYLAKIVKALKENDFPAEYIQELIRLAHMSGPGV
jgi:gamma-glutamylcyclotransferase (GGCT)/AIG2-like uncharacterized protein YtfP